MNVIYAKFIGFSSSFIRKKYELKWIENQSMQWLSDSSQNTGDIYIKYTTNKNITDIKNI